MYIIKTEPFAENLPAIDRSHAARKIRNICRSRGDFGVIASRNCRCAFPSHRQVSLGGGPCASARVASSQFLLLPT